MMTFRTLALLGAISCFAACSSESADSSTMDAAQPSDSMHDGATNCGACSGPDLGMASDLASASSTDLAASNNDLAQNADLAQSPDLAPPPGSPDCHNAASWPAAWVNLENDVLTLVNQKRAQGATCGSTTYAAAGPLTMNAQLRVAARCHSLDMATSNFTSHTGSNGSTPAQRISAAGYSASGWGENIGWGFTTASAMVAWWMGSSGHCANIMTASFVDIGIGYAYNAASTYGEYWTTDFGH